MPLDHSNATATISITGLALGCYNLKTNNYEVGFIRDSNHLLTISVFLRSADNTVSTVTFELDKHHRIFIETEGGIKPKEPFYKPTPEKDFDRDKEDQDREDFQWILDLDRELNRGTSVQLKRPELPITEMYISKPMLYADAEGFANGTVKLVNLADPNDSKPFGELCEVIKGDIRCEEGGAVILRIEGPLGFSYCLPRIPGKTHQIVMKNLCPTPAASGPSGGSASDFKVYYAVVQDTAGKKFSLELERTDVHNPDGVCNASNSSGLMSLFPLPK